MTHPAPIPTTDRLGAALRAAGFTGEIETDRALRLAMSTDNSVYQILPDLIVAPRSSADLVTLTRVMAQPDFATIPITARGGGTGTNGQSLNRGVIVDLRRHMNRMIEVNAAEGWVDVEPGIVRDDLNEQLRPFGLFFAPETSTSNRCTIGGMVATDASGKGSRVYGKTSDNILGLEIARPEGLLSSLAPVPGWAQEMLASAEAAARQGRAAFVANTPRLNRRFTGYDLERACPEDDGSSNGARFDWWRLFPGSEGTLGLMSRIRLRLRRIEAEQRLLVVGFDSFRNALASALPLMAIEPTAVEVMDEWVQHIAEEAGILARLPEALRPTNGAQIAYTFIEFNGDDPAQLDAKLTACAACLHGLEGVGAIHVAKDRAEISDLWAIRSAGVGLLGKIDSEARPVAFVEDCVVPPEHLPAFLDDFLGVLRQEGLGFGIYGHVDVGCLHVRPALNLDQMPDRAKLVAVSDAVFALTRKYGGIFWGEHGKGLRGAYLRGWIGEEAYAALCGVKAAFDPEGRYNAGKLVVRDGEIMGIANTPFRRFNAPETDPLMRAFRCNGNAQCHSYAKSVPMCPSFKASADARLSPKGRADALRRWHESRAADPALEADLLGSLDQCLGCKACATTCPVQVDIPTMRSAFYEDYYNRHTRPLADRAMLLAERLSPILLRSAPVLRPVWPVAARLFARLSGQEDLPDWIAPALASQQILHARDLPRSLPKGTVILVRDWFTALFDAQIHDDARQALLALGYAPVFLEMRPAGKLAQSLGDTDRFRIMAQDLADLLNRASATGAPLVGLDPAFVMQLRQDYPKAAISAPRVELVQEFLTRELNAGASWPRAGQSETVTLLTHCTEASGAPAAKAQWQKVFAALGLKAETPATGCCGMAGTFGHQVRHRDMSRKLFDLSWRARIAGNQPIAASGYSCRCQIDRLSECAVRTPLGLIAEALTRAPSRQRP